MYRSLATYTKALVVAGSTASVSFFALAQTTRAESSKKIPAFASVPSRAVQLEKLKSNEIFDILIVGGGATGSGAALDAVTRGLKVALVEKDDFSSGSSSRSTKLIHGGVRYLEQAVLKFDYGSLSLVFDALRERSIFLNMAPHLTQPLPIMTPCYKYWEIPYFYVGMKMYDLLAATQMLHSSRFLGLRESMRQFPMLNKDELKGTIIYYDGQMNDARMNVSIALTAASKGATVANHVEVLELLKSKETNKIYGAKVRDEFTGQSWDVLAKVVINATGPFADRIRKMSSPTIKDIIAPSSGVHIILPDYYCSRTTGLIVPRTKDGRVIFLLPWQGQTIAGTTDSATKVTHFPHARESEIKFILDTIEDYVNVKVRREDVSAAWSGIRPLVVHDKSAKDTASMSRDHLIEVTPEGLLTIVGGKWTTFRKMAQDIVTKAVEIGELTAPKECQTKTLKLIGGEDWDDAFFTVLIQDYKRMKTTKNTKQLVKINSDIAQHLSHSYGSRALKVAQIAQDGYGNRLADGYPYLEAEVVYAVQEEMACTAVDVLARRTRLAFLDTDASLECTKRVVDIMADTLKWDEKRKQQEMESARYFLHIMTVGQKDEYSFDARDQSVI